MLVDFTQMQEQTLPNYRGGAGALLLRSTEDAHNKLMYGRLAPGSSIGLHTHETNAETIWYLSGRGKMLCDGAYEPAAPGLCHYCPRGHTHSLVNDGADDLVFFAAVSQA